MENNALKLALTQKAKEFFMAEKFDDGIRCLMDLAREFGREVHISRATLISETINGLSNSEIDSGMLNFYRKQAIQLIDSIVPTARPNPTIYVSYSQNKKNNYWIKKFLAHFNPIKYYMDIWHPGIILAGSDRAQEFKKEMESAEVLVFLLDIDFFGDKFCEEQKKHATLLKNTKNIVPVYLEAHFHEGDFIGRKYLPEGGKAIKDYKSSADRICVEIVEKIIELIK